MHDPVEPVDLRRGDPKVWHRVHDKVLQAAGPFRSALAEGWEDAVQEAVIRLLRAFHKGQFREGTSLDSFTWRVTRNVCLDEMRRQRVRRADSLNEITEPSAFPITSPSVTAERREHREQIFRLVAVMPEECRELLLLLEEGKSYGDLAWQLGVAPGALRARVHRCRQRARTQWTLMTSPVVDAAHRLFREHGYVGVSMNRIANAADVPLAELEGLFKDKSELFMTIVHRMATGVQGMAVDEIDFVRPIRSTPDPAQRIHRASRLTAAMYERGLADLHGMVREAANTDPRHRDLLKWMRATQVQVGLKIGRAIMAGRRPHGVETVDSLSHAATAIVNPDNYLPRIRQRGWTPTDFWEWAQAQVTRIFLP